MKPYIPAVAILLFATASCRHDSQEEAHAHDETISLTNYSPEFEVFAEATPFATGHASEILAHFTRLEDSSPLSGASVTAILTCNGNQTEQTLDSSIRPGIYKFTLTPKTEGDATLAFSIKDHEREYNLVAGTVHVYPDFHEACEAAEEEEAKIPHSPNAVVFTKEMAWKSGVATGPATLRPMSEVYRTTAKVISSQGDATTITAPVAGIVTFAGPSLTEGSDVAKGEVLFRIDASASPDNNLRQRAAEAANNLETAEKEYRRVSELRKEKLATESEVERARNNLNNARAASKALSAGTKEGCVTVTAPLNGFVTSLMVTNGQYAETGQSLATVAQNRDLLVRAEVSPTFQQYLPFINDVTIKRPEASAYSSMKESGGSIVSYGKAVDEGSQLIPIIIRMGNADFLQGTYADAWISAGPETPIIAVPTGALVEESGSYYVYAQLSPELFDKRPVSIGRSDGIFTEITSGLNEGERIVTKGAVFVKLAASTGTLDAHSGHAH